MNDEEHDEQRHAPEECMPKGQEFPDLTEQEENDMPLPVAPGKWLGLDWAYDPETAADINYWKWAAGFFERLYELDDDEIDPVIAESWVGRLQSNQPAADHRIEIPSTEIPANQRTPAASLTAASRWLGYSTCPETDDKGRQQVTRDLIWGILHAQRVSPRKWWFDKREMGC